MNVLVEVFALVDFDVTETLAVQSTPAVSPEIEMLFTEEVLEIELENIIELSLSFLTITFTFTPADGIAELILTTIACVVPVTAKILPTPGSTFMEKTIEASIGVGGGGEVFVTKLVAPPIILVQVFPL